MITPIQTYDGLSSVTSIFTVECAAGDSVTDVFQIPAGMTMSGITIIGSVDAADIAFKVKSTESGTLRGPVRSSGGGGYLKCAVAADAPVAYPSGDALKWPFVQILFCTANNAADVTPVVQQAKRTVEIVLSRFMN